MKLALFVAQLLSYARSTMNMLMRFRALFLPLALCAFVENAEAITEVWRRTSGSGSAGLDEGRCVATDASGNVYSAGFRSAAFFQYVVPQPEAFIVKYSPAGEKLWSFRYNPLRGAAPGEGDFPADAEAVAIAVNGVGEVITAINSRGPDGRYDGVILKLDGNGQLVRERRLNQPGLRLVQIKRMIVRADGGIYLLGSDPEKASGYHPALLRATGDGTVMWRTGLDAAEGTNSPVAIGADASGAVYVGSSLQLSSGGPDMRVQRINPDGTSAWIRTFSGGTFDTEEVADLAVDADGNSAVCGHVFSTTLFQDRMHVRRYNAAGDLLWSDTFNASATNATSRAQAVKLDAGGNVLIAGFADNGIGAGNDIVVAKYSSVGTRLWSSAYNAGLNVVDESLALAVDGAGNPIVAGQSGPTGSTSSVVVRLDAADGHQLWAAQPGGTPPYTANAPGIIAVDGTGHVALAGYTGSAFNGSTDMFTTLLDSAGAKLWSAFESQEGAPDSPTCLSVAADGTTWVSGTAGTLRYDSAGLRLPVGVGSLRSGSYSDVALLGDGSGGIFLLSGSTFSVVNANEDFGLVHYGANGSLLWQATHNGAANLNDSPSAMAVDSAGMVIAAGTTQTGFNTSDVLVVKFDPANFGGVVWFATYNSPTSLIERVVGVGVDSSANVYVGGDEIAANGRRNFFVLKLNPAGVQQWIFRYDGPDPIFSDDQAAAFSVDSAGNSTIAGTLVHAGGTADMSVVRVNSAGVQQWATQRGAASTNYAVRSLSVDAAGNCSIGAGRSVFDGITYEAQMKIVRLDATGAFQWETGLGRAGVIISPSTMRLAGGAGGELYAALGERFASGASAPLAAKLNSAGEIVWQLHLPNPDGSSSFPVDIALAGDSSLRVIAYTGPTDAIGDPRDYLTIRIDQTSGAPGVVTQSVSNTKWTALVNPNGLQTAVSFEFGAGAFTATTPAVNVSGDSEQTVEFMPSGLAPHTTYFIRAIATNTGGTSRSELLTLITPNESPVTQPDEVTSDGGAVDILPLANDSDPDGDPLQVITYTGSFPAGMLTQNGNTITFTPADGFEGDFQISNQITDGFSVPIDVSATVYVRRASPAARAIASKRGLGDPVPGAPTGTTFYSFGQPTINGINAAFRATTIRGTVKSDAIFSGAPLARLVGTGDTAPGAGTATFAAIGDPIYIMPTIYAFTGKLKGTEVTPKNDTGIWAEFGTGIGLLVREGDEAPGTGGAAFDSFVSVEAVSGGVYFYAKLRTKGAAKVTSANDFGVWFHNSLAVLPVLREGDPLTVPGPTVRTVTRIEALLPIKGASTERRVSPFNSPPRLAARITLNDKTQAIAELIPNSAPQLVARTSIADPSGRFPSKLGIPDSFQTGIAALVTWKPMLGVVTTKDDSAIVIHKSDGSVDIVVRESEPAPGLTGAKFLSFGDPIGARQTPIYENYVAFRATVSGAGFTAANNTGIWRYTAQPVGVNPPSAPVLIARKGAEAPGTSGAKFTSFDSMATMDENDFSVLFTGKLAGRGVKAANNFGLWAADTGPTPKLVLRTGQQVTVGASTKTISLFSVLGPVLGTPTQHRASEAGGRRIAVRASFTDRTEGVLTVRVP